jgi:hypothetical protein
MLAPGSAGSSAAASERTGRSTDITGTGKRVAVALWNSGSYSMIQMMRRTRPAKMVIIHVNNAATFI